MDDEKYSDKNFYVTIDNNDFKPILKQKYGKRIFFYKRKKIDKIQNSYQNIANDLIELILLSKNNILIGNESSSFFRMGTFFSRPGSEIFFV